MALEINKKITPNKNQLLCINEIEGPVMVLAGPGTGKTFVLIERISRMLNLGIKPSEILCLTFSEAAANEMKSRLLKKVGPKAASVSINTYHSFCNDIINKYPSKFELFEGVKLIDDISKVNLVKESMDEIQPKSLVNRWGDYYYYINDFINSVNEIKKNRINKEIYFDILKNDPNWIKKLELLEYELEERIKSGKTKNKTKEKEIINQKKKIEKAKEIWAIFEIYQKKMNEKNFIDFNDMINFVLDIFEEDQEFLSIVASKYKYFLVDEYQDTNLLQNSIINLLSKGANNQNIFVVGDDDQIIYGFQGASNDNLEKFLNKYPETKVICLNENNRSTQYILDLSYLLISQDKTRLEFNSKYKKYNITKKLIAKNQDLYELNKPVFLDVYNEKIEENNKIIERIQDISLKIPEKLNEIAILTRDNQELKEFALLCESNNIPYQIKTNKSIFELKSSIITYFYLKMLNNHILSSDKIFGLLTTEPFAFDLEDYNFLLEQSYPKFNSFIKIIEDNKNRVWKNNDKIKEFIKTYKELQVLKTHKSLKALVWLVISKTGILDYYEKSIIDKFENIESLNRLLEEAESFENLNKDCSLNDFINHLDFAFAQNIPIEIKTDNTIQNAIQLLTLHGSKGREFEYVFMPNLIAKNWENKSIPNTLSLPVKYQDDIEQSESLIISEQLKLLFVGITRAKHTLYLSFSQRNKNRLNQLTKYLSEVEFNTTIKTQIHDQKEFNHTNELIKSLSLKNYNYYLAYEREIKSRVNNIVINPHTLSMYLNCPRSFLYRSIYKLKNYDNDTSIMDYGNAIHSSIDLAVKIAIESGCYPKVEEFIRFFEERLATFKFKDINIFNTYLERGRKSLARYYVNLCSINPKNIYKREFDLGEINIDNFKITGRIDRVEKNKDGSFSLYDYKTGAAKSISKIADGEELENYLDQLRFYKYAFEKKYNESKVSSVGLIFVEEPDKNIYLNLSSNDDNIIELKIKEMFRSIQELKFDPIEVKAQNHCENCKYCDYKMLCKLEV